MFMFYTESLSNKTCTRVFKTSALENQASTVRPFRSGVDNFKHAIWRQRFRTRCHSLYFRAPYRLRPPHKEPASPRYRHVGPRNPSPIARAPPRLWTPMQLLQTRLEPSSSQGKPRCSVASAGSQTNKKHRKPTVRQSVTSIRV